MTPRVVDASALLHALAGRTAESARLRATLCETECHAPHLVDAEVGNVLRKQTLRGEIAESRAHAMLRSVHGVVDYRYPDLGSLADRAWALRGSLSFYDALYVALAAGLDVPLLTGDRRLARAPGLPCEVDLVTDP